MYNFLICQILDYAFFGVFRFSYFCIWFLVLVSAHTDTGLLIKLALRNVQQLNTDLQISAKRDIIRKQKLIEIIKTYTYTH